MGGGTEIHQPSPPPQPSTAEAIEAWTEAMPEVYQTQMEYAPQLAQQQVELAQQYAQPMGQAMQQAQAAMYPETAALQEQLAGQAQTGMEEGLSEQELDFYRSELAGQLGTNVGSGVGANYMGQGLLQAQQQRQDYFRNLGLSVAGRAPLAQPSTPQTPNYMGGFTPGSTMNFMSSTYGPYAAASRPMQTQSPDYLSGVGSLLQGGAMMGGMLGFSSIRFKKNVKLWA